MRIYLAMWSRGQRGKDVSKEDMDANKLYARGTAKILRSMFDENEFAIECPHENTTLNQIDDLWLETKDERYFPIAMDLCFTLLDKCQGIILIHRGYMSEGMESEKKYAESKGMFVYEAFDLTDDVKEDLVCAINEVSE